MGKRSILHLPSWFKRAKANNESVCNDNPLDLYDPDNDITYYSNNQKPNKKPSYNSDEKHDINYYIKKGIYRGGLTTNRRYNYFSYSPGSYQSSSDSFYDDQPRFYRRREEYKKEVQEQQADPMKVDEAWHNAYLNVVKLFKSKNRQYVKNLSIEDPLYTENHHIKPVCIGGTDEESNFVRVSKDEHKTLHMLLCKAFPNNDSLYTAVMKMVYGDTLLEENLYLKNYTTNARSCKMDELLKEMIDKSVIDKSYININQ